MKVKFYQWRLLRELPVIMKSIKCVTLVSSEHTLIHDVDSFQVQLTSSQLPPALAPWINYRTCSKRISSPYLTIGWRKISWRQLLPCGSPSDGLKNEIPINHLAIFSWSSLRKYKPRRYKLSSLLRLSIWFVYSYFEKGCRKNVHATIPRGNMGYVQYIVPDTVVVEPTFVAFL